ncbi:MAG: hypothetical protein ACI9X4_002564 [Glaciecola sp.]|jgi:hypothetical protein
MKYLSLLALLPLFACASPQMNESSASPWVSLFDGQSFEHWRGYGKTEMPAGWVLDDGCMYAAESGAGMDLVTHQTFTHFELELEWRVVEGGNSGIMWHVDESAGGYPWMTGPEYQILDNAAYNDGKPGLNSAGSNYAVYAPTGDSSRPAGEWNQTSVLVSGNHVQQFLNGVKVVDYVKGSADWAARVAKSKWTKWPSYCTTTTGHIALQGDHGNVWFKNLRVRELPDPSPK